MKLKTRKQILVDRYLWMNRFTLQSHFATMKFIIKKNHSGKETSHQDNRNQQFIVFDQESSDWIPLNQAIHNFCPRYISFVHFAFFTCQQLKIQVWESLLVEWKPIENSMNKTTKLKRYVYKFRFGWIIFRFCGFLFVCLFILKFWRANNKICIKMMCDHWTLDARHWKFAKKTIITNRKGFQQQI